MNSPDTSTGPASDSSQQRRGFHAGDLVLPASGYPLLCEIVVVETTELLRIRGLDWPAGYTALVRATDYRLVTGRLAS